MELDSVLELAWAKVLVRKQDTKSLQNDKRTTAIVINARSATVETISRVDGVQMTADDDGLVATTRHLDNHGLLRKGSVWKHLSGNAVLSRLLHNIRNLAEEPFGGLRARLRLTEAGVVRGVVLEVLLDIVPAELRDETPDVLLVLELLGVGRLLLDRANLGIELGDVEEVTSAAAALLSQ
jgi:hypothetical protein